MKRLIGLGRAIWPLMRQTPNASGCVWGPAKWGLLVIILAGFATLCPAQRRPTASPLKKIVQLPEPRLMGPISFEEALAKRQSVREFTRQGLSFAKIGQLAWAGQGVTEAKGGFRTAPSAGVIYPMKLYFVTPKGLYVYNPDEHSLEEISNQDIRGKLATAALRQKVVADAACNIVVAGSVRKLSAKYGNKARRFVLLQAGHIAQNIQLQATSMELGSVPVGTFDINQVRKVCTLPTDLEPLYIVCVGYPAKQAIREVPGEQKQPGEIGRPSIKRAALIVARENFRDEELFETKRQLEMAGVETLVASTKTGPVTGMLGARAESVALVHQLRVDDFDAIVFIGGSGATEYFNSRVALDIVRQAANRRKVVAAICIAPTVLANAGVLRGLRATSFPSERDRLQQAGAIYTGVPVERDRLVITARDPIAAGQFGRAIAEALAGR